MAIVRCSHAGCTCLPAPGLNFCSTNCELKQEQGLLADDVGCECGHYGCDPRAIDTPVELQPEINPLDSELGIAKFELGLTARDF